MITAHVQRREIADFANVWFEFLGLAGNSPTRMVQETLMKEIFSEGWTELRVTWGFCYPETNGNRKMLSLLGLKEQREEIVLPESSERAKAGEEGLSDRTYHTGEI